MTVVFELGGSAVACAILRLVVKTFGCQNVWLSKID